MNILITGGAGFIGSNFIKYMLDKYQYTIVNVDELTYAGNLNNISEFDSFHNYNFVKGNIGNPILINNVFREFNIEIVINFAAESHVDRSILNPDIFLKSNILGTHTLLDTSRKFWARDKSDNFCTEYIDGVKFIQISTDEVYGTLGAEGFFTENTPLAPNSPYSASKASADLFVRSYFETYKLPVNITRCSNNYGPRQHQEKLIPLLIFNALNNEEFPIYGNGLQIRDWLHVEDHCKAIDAVLHKGQEGEVYNIGGNNEKRNIDIAKLILEYFGKSEKLIKYVPDRLGHDTRYAIDNSKIKNELNWVPHYTFEEGINMTIKWYLNYYKHLPHQFVGKDIGDSV
ncbi:dTDP-glucose 4,6-dehydratase [Bacillus sp. AFS040349]|uniref:dTDP-glucose 4,6-dehydratase n=1 Tax=Bacillus sp. AFS040349 TaxID=2033502 RepID=UPI000BFDF5D1|nr:dTDP-glucose 4,6-dehydratase [Bacillus sp. AFS040349]PGT81121.1 dTDP-glucose 4,6-dehydratase [Bacillus sp. AFS040349]